MTKVAFYFYGVMFLVAAVGAWYFELDLFGLTDVAWGRDIGLGLAVGLGTVGLSRVLDHVFAWARELTQGFREILGPGSVQKALILAVLSSFGEEAFFRGFLQNGLSEWLGALPALFIASIIFGLIHIGPDAKRFLPWTVMALVMGFVLGGMWMWTQNLVAVILAHFLVNFINLTLIFRQEAP